MTARRGERLGPQLKAEVLTAGPKFAGGPKAYGLAERGVGPAFIALDELDPPSQLPQEVQDQVRELADRIVSGEIVVTDFLAQGG